MARSEFVTQNAADPKPNDQSWKEYLGMVGELLDVLTEIAEYNRMNFKALLLACRILLNQGVFPWVDEAAELCEAGRLELLFAAIRKTSKSINICRICGCMESDACFEDRYWVKPDLCSGCANKYEDSAQAIQEQSVEQGQKEAQLEQTYAAWSNAAQTAEKG